MTVSEDPAADASARRERPRVVATADIQRQVTIRLVLGGLFFMLVAAVAAYFYVFPPGIENPRAATEVVHAFMLAGAEGDVSNANRLFSVDAIRAGSRPSVENLFAQRHIFRTYRGLDITRFEMRKEGRDTQAVFEARVLYAAEPSGSVAARMIVENDAWRIQMIRVDR